MSTKYMPGQNEKFVRKDKEGLKHDLPILPMPSKLATFILTFWSYFIMKTANKCFSLVQSILIKEEWFRSDIYEQTATGQTGMIGLISTLFLCCYAFGQFFVGTLADRVDLRYFLTGAMITAGMLTVLFGLLGVLGYRELWAYCVVWSLNGFAQACGWPSNLTIMNNWFGKKSRGLIFSAWSSNSNFGSIMAAILCGVIFSVLATNQSVWETCMITCGVLAIAGAIPIFCLLVPDPSFIPDTPVDKIKPPPARSTRNIPSSRIVPVSLKQLEIRDFQDIVEEPVARSEYFSQASCEPQECTESASLHTSSNRSPTTVCAPPQSNTLCSPNSTDDSRASPPPSVLSSSSSQSSSKSDMTESCKIHTPQGDEPSRQRYPGSVGTFDADESDSRDTGGIVPSVPIKRQVSGDIGRMYGGDVHNASGAKDVEVGSTVMQANSPQSSGVMKSVSAYLSTLYAGLMVRGVIPYMVIYATVKGVVYIFIYWMPFFLISAKGQSNSMAALVSAIFDIGAFVGAILSGYATDVLGSRTAVIIGMILFSIVFTLILFDERVTSVAATLVCLLLIGLSIGGAQVLISASVALDLGDSALNRSSKKRTNVTTPSPDTSASPLSVTCLAAVNTVTATDQDDAVDGTQKSAKKLAGTISGMIEGSGSTGAAVLQFVVGELLVCTTAGDEDSNVTCSWMPIMAIIVIANVLSLACLLYIKFSSRLLAALMRVRESAGAR